MGKQGVCGGIYRAAERLGVRARAGNHGVGFAGDRGRLPLRGRAARKEDGADGMGPPVSGRAGDASYRPSGVRRGAG
jgi:hypothetical protein